MPMDTREDHVRAGAPAAGRAGAATPTATPPFPAAPRRAGVAAPAFVWSVWGVLSVGLLAYVWAFGSAMPLADDWELVPVLSGAEPLTGAWLWEPNYEHRIPVPKLVLAALAAPGYDPRAGMLFNCLALAALSFAMIRAAKRLRGRT